MAPRFERQPPQRFGTASRDPHSTSRLHDVATVTFLFTDIEGSTRLITQLRERYEEVLRSTGGFSVMRSSSTAEKWSIRAATRSSSRSTALETRSHRRSRRTRRWGGTSGRVVPGYACASGCTPGGAARRARLYRSRRSPCDADLCGGPGQAGAALAGDGSDRRGRPRRYPTDPSICSWISRFISTAYSSGSSLTIGSTKPETIMAEASASERPRLWR